VSIVGLIGSRGLEVGDAGPLSAIIRASMPYCNAVIALLFISARSKLVTVSRGVVNLVTGEAVRRRIGSFD